MVLLPKELSGSPAIPFAGLAVALLALAPSAARAQSASLLQREIPPPPAVQPTLRQVSLIRQPDPRPFQVHDLINIKINERINQRNNAQANRRRFGQFQYTWADLVVLLSGLRLRSDQTIRATRPSINVSSLNNLQSQFQFFRNDLFTATIQAQVVEIKPNGNLVIEANGVVAVNNEQNTYKVSGIVNPADVDMVTRSISSELVASKRVELFQVGPTRDGYRRGFLVRLLDMFLPY